MPGKAKAHKTPAKTRTAKAPVKPRNAKAPARPQPAPQASKQTELTAAPPKKTGNRIKEMA